MRTLALYTLCVTIPTCHPDRPHRAKGLCGPCYVKSRPEYGRARVPRSVVAQLLEAQGGRCAYCERPLEPREATADHVIPRKDGGSDDILNLVAACARCNSQKWADDPAPGLGHRGSIRNPYQEMKAAMNAGSLSLAQAAAELGLSKSTLQTQVNRGRIAAQLVGRQYVIERAELERYRLESLGQPGRPEKPAAPGVPADMERQPGGTTKWSVVKATVAAERAARKAAEEG